MDAEDLVVGAAGIGADILALRFNWKMLRHGSFSLHHHFDSETVRHFLALLPSKYNGVYLGSPQSKPEYGGPLVIEVHFRSELWFILGSILEFAPLFRNRNVCDQLRTLWPLFILT